MSVKDLTTEERIAIGKACRYLRLIYEIDAKKMARKINRSQGHLLRTETQLIPSPKMCESICSHFRVDVKDAVAIGKCKNPIEVFLYLQGVGVIPTQTHSLPSNP